MHNVAVSDTLLILSRLVLRAWWETSHEHCDRFGLCSRSPSIRRFSSRADMPWFPISLTEQRNVNSDCRLSDETVERFRRTGLHKTLLPAAYGGYEMGFSALLETSYAIGKVCASSAWVCGIYMAGNWFGGLFPKQVQDEIWGEDPGSPSPARSRR